jgi:hypothetical protein
MARSCFHGRFLSSGIEFTHSTKISCEKAVEIFREANGIWERICRRYGEGNIEFWVVLDHNSQNPIIASCCQYGVYFNIGLWREGLTAAEDTTSRMAEELYHLHERRVQGIESTVPPHRIEKIDCIYSELKEGSS